MSDTQEGWPVEHKTDGPVAAAFVTLMEENARLRDALSGLVRSCNDVTQALGEATPWHLADALNAADAALAARP